MKHLIPILAVLAVAIPHAVRAEDAPKSETAAPKAGKTKKGKKSAAAASEAKADAAPKVVTKDDGLVIEDLKIGDGMEAKEGSRVKVHYRGTFLNGKEFDSNMSAKADTIEPFTLDKNHLIAGWVEGIPGMKVGGKRKLKVPYKLAYGENGTPDGSIPPKADLNFEVELLKVE